MEKSVQSQAINLLDLKPARNLEWEQGENDGVILLVPKFQNRYLVKYIMPNMRKPYFRIKLDEHGSFIWKLCDGSNTVGEISDKTKERFGEKFDPTFERIGKFVNQLIRDKFLMVDSMKQL